MTRCPVCTKEIPDGATSCTACGETLVLSSDESPAPQHGSPAGDQLDESADQTRRFANTPGKSTKSPTSGHGSAQPSAHAGGRQSGSTSFESIDDSRFVPGTILA